MLAPDRKVLELQLNHLQLLERLLCKGRELPAPGQVQNEEMLAESVVPRVVPQSNVVSPTSLTDRKVLDLQLAHLQLYQRFLTNHDTYDDDDSKDSVRSTEKEEVCVAGANLEVSIDAADSPHLAQGEPIPEARDYLLVSSGLAQNSNGDSQSQTTATPPDVEIDGLANKILGAKSKGLKLRISETTETPSIQSQVPPNCAKVRRHTNGRQSLGRIPVSPCGVQFSSPVRQGSGLFLARAPFPSSTVAGIGWHGGETRSNVARAPMNEGSDNMQYRSEDSTIIEKPPHFVQGAENDSVLKDENLPISSHIGPAMGRPQSSIHESHGTKPNPMSLFPFGQCDHRNMPQMSSASARPPSCMGPAGSSFCSRRSFPSQMASPSRSWELRECSPHSQLRTRASSDPLCTQRQGAPNSPRPRLQTNEHQNLGKLPMSLRGGSFSFPISQDDMLRSRIQDCRNPQQSLSFSVQSPSPTVQGPEANTTAQYRRGVATSYSDTNYPRSVQHATQQSASKLAVFDFDCTLTVTHVFASLAGITSTRSTLSVPPPHAKTEKGQLCRLSELDADPKWGMGVFALMVFGGESRVSQLQCLLQGLTASGVECVILSKGMVGPMQKCLQQVNLLRFFSRIIGSLGSSYGLTGYDSNQPVFAHGLEQFLGKADADIHMKRSKVEYIKHMMSERSLRFEQVVFLEDEIEDINAATSICKTIHITAGQGAQEREFQLLREKLNEPAS